MFGYNFALQDFTLLYFTMLGFAPLCLDITLLCIAPLRLTKLYSTSAAPDFTPLKYAVFGYSFALLRSAMLFYTSLYYTRLDFSESGYNFASLNYAKLSSGLLHCTLPRSAGLRLFRFYFFYLIASVALAVGADAVSQSGILHCQPYFALIELCLVKV